MAHFALLNNDNIVIDIIAIDNKDILNSDGIENEKIGIDFCNSLIPGKWLQTSYSRKFRKNFATIGMIYDQKRDAFITQQPYPSWIFNEETYQWQSPVPNKYEEYLKEYRKIGGITSWDETNQKWIYKGPKIYSKQELLSMPPPPSGDNKIPDMGYLDFTGIYPGD
jgi:hypothetical protein